ncbi:MAG: DUF616 domain-containing protein [Eubacterium sp.]|nr:DUF616 domain-containing protein [Eubacterium sp.]
MTGKEKNARAFFREIKRMEKLAGQYRGMISVRRGRKGKEDSSPIKRFRQMSVKDAARKGKWKLGGWIRKKVNPVSRTEQNLALDRQSAAERKELYIREEKIVVYTALFGDYDSVPEPQMKPENIDYVLLTDQPFPEKTCWQRCRRESLLPEELRSDPILCNRWCKMHPHLLFPEYTYSIYIDSNIRVFSDLTPVAAGLDRYPVAMFRHKKRDCVYEEVQACIDQKKADPISLRRHEETIRTHGIPPKWGLLEASIIARKHMDPACISLMDDWWEAFRSNSRRDQISLIDVLWQAEISPDKIGTLGYNLQRCDLFVQEKHRIAKKTARKRNEKEKHKRQP